MSRNVSEDLKIAFLQSNLFWQVSCARSKTKARTEISSWSNKPKLVNKRVCLQSANGSELSCDGCVTVQICIGGTKVSQAFYVIRDLNRNLILGLDCYNHGTFDIYIKLSVI